MSKEAKAWFLVWRKLWMEQPKATAAGFFQGIVEGIRPFIAIYYTALIIDAAYAGEALDTLISYALLGGSITMVLSMIHGFTTKIFNQNLECMFERQAGPLAKKSMQMDFELLEEPEIHRLREEIVGFKPRFGLIGMVLDCTSHTMKAIATFICTLLLIVPRLSGIIGNKGSFISSIGFVLLFFISFLLLNMVHIQILNRRNEKRGRLFNERSVQRTRSSFYMNLYAKAESQKDIILCGQESIIEEELDTIEKKSNDNKKRLIKLMCISAIEGESVSAISTVLVFMFAAIYGYLGIISIGSVVSFASSIKLVADQIYMLTSSYSDFKYQGTYAVKYLDFLELRQRKHEGTIPLEKRQDNKFTIEFEHVSFKYPGSSRYALKDLNLKFVVGEKLAIVGKNGSGKTTFIKLLCRLYDVTEGCIKVNGIDIRKYDYQEYCDLFSVVFQDFDVFAFPLGESLACSVNVNEERATDALSKAGMYERFTELPEGFQTYIGKGFDENGVNFSGGEKQKIAIARAIYKDAPFVIMDEPTAALDPEAEAEVFEGFDKMVGKKTAIYISHRLASCKFCEDILVFDDGKVVQHGSHEELETQDGLYQKLWNAQAMYYA